MNDFDVCVIGSGAGGGPIALSLARAGRSVVVLEKGPWLKEQDFFKDEIGASRRPQYWPDPKKEPQVVETLRSDGEWSSRDAWKHGWEFWNGNMVGGSSNLMSGFFHRLKPQDFRLLSELGPVDGANVADWPISYDDLEPYYALVENEVGVSGRVAEHPHADRRSTASFPYPPLAEHPLSTWIDRECTAMGLHPFPVPRAILSVPASDRISCSYSNYCGSYGCATGAKGSSRAALLDKAVATGRCEIRPHSMARRIITDAQGKAIAVEYHDVSGSVRTITAKVFVVACQAIESARLLLLSTGPRHPDGIGNNQGQVGRNLVFSTAAWGRAELRFDRFETAQVDELRSPMPFINRAVQDYYFYDEPGGGRRKGGTLEFLFAHPNPIGRAIGQAYAVDDGPLWGWPLKERLERHFKGVRHLMFEVFADWMPTPEGFVSLDPDVKDRFGLPVARVRIGKHPRNQETATFLAERGVEILERLGGTNAYFSSRGAPATNLLAGTCRFGRDPAQSVLDVDCRVHDAQNVYVTDGSFMPTGGSVPFTWTIYANSFRVAEKIRAAV